eukprot:g3413.t1
MLSQNDTSCTPLLEERRTSEFLNWFSRLPYFWWNCGPLCLISFPLCLFFVSFSTAVLEDDLPVMELLFLRSIPALIFISFFQTIQNGSLDFGKKEKLHLILAHTIAGALTNIFAFAAISLIPLADALTIIYGNIAATAFLSWSMKLEKLHYYASIGVLLCMAGLVFVIQPTFLFPSDSEDSEHRDLGLLLAGLSCISSTSVILIKRAIGTDQRPDMLSFYSLLTLIPVCFIFLSAGYPDGPVYSKELWHYGLITLNALGSLLGSILMHRSVVLVSGTLAAIASSFQMILAHLTDVFIRNEEFSFYVLIGSLLMICGSGITVFARRSVNS